MFLFHCDDYYEEEIIICLPRVPGNERITHGTRVYRTRLTDILEYYAVVDGRRWR